MTMKEELSESSFDNPDMTDYTALSEEEIDIEELPESEQGAVRKRSEEREAREAHLSQEERYQNLRNDALQLARERGRISTCTIQRYLYHTGYGTAARIIDELHSAGLIEPAPSGFRVYVPVR